eukprot:758638_1
MLLSVQRSIQTSYRLSSMMSRVTIIQISRLNYYCRVQELAVPTLMIYQDGKPLAQHSGMITQQGLEDWLDVNLFSKNLDSTTNTKPAKEDHATNDATTSNKRGFVSFVSGG